MYLHLGSDTKSDLTAVFKHDLNVTAGQSYNVVVEVHSRDHQTTIKQVTVDALLGYCIKDELRQHFQCELSVLHLAMCCACRSMSWLQQAVCMNAHASTCWAPSQSA